MNKKPYQDMSIILQWSSHSYYVVEAAFSEFNPLSRYVFFTGFLHGAEPGNYNQFFGDDEKLTFNDCIYIKPLQLIYTETNHNLVEPITFAKERINGSNT
jgi:hypothetical protein